VSQHIIPTRYLRSLGTVGWDGQKKLLEATVVIIGAGGLGGWIIEGLARMGVGHLVVVDGDVFEENNLNRQLLCTEGSLGEAKTASVVSLRSMVPSRWRSTGPGPTERTCPSSSMVRP